MIDKTSDTHKHSQVKGQENAVNKLDVSLSDLYEKDVVCLKSDATVFDAAKLMLENHIGDVVIVESKNKVTIPVGILTDRDIVLNTTAKRLAPESVKISEIMTQNIVTANEQSSLMDIVRTMTDEGINRLPIVDDSGNLKGLLSSKQLFQFFARGLCDLSSISSQQQRREEKTH